MRVLSVALALAGLAQAPGRPEPSDAAAGVVRVDVIATDARGRAVPTLSASDFEVRDDGVPRPIDEARFIKVDPSAVASGDPLPAIQSRADERAEAARENTRLIAIYLDEYHVSSANTARVRDLMARFVDQDLGPRDLVTILRPLDSLLTIRLTRDRAALHRAIDAFEGRRGDYTPRNAFERNYMANQAGRADSQRAQATWSTLNALALHLANLGLGRKTLLIASEAADPVFPRRGLETLPTASSVTRIANRSNVSIYVADPRKTAVPAEGPDVLRVLVDDTDGELMAGTDLEEGLRRMLNDASAYYLLTYRSSRIPDGLFHAVDVKVKRSGVRLRARKGYSAPTPDEIQRATFVARANDPKAVNVVAAEPPSRASPLIRPWFGMDRGANGKTRVTFVWEPAARVPGDRLARTPSRVTLKALGADGGSIFDGTVLPAGPAQVGARGDLSARAVFEAPPGRLRLRMSIQDQTAQVIDTDVRQIVIRDLGAPIVLATPEVLRARTARDVRALAADLNAVPVAAREFSRSEYLIIRVAAYVSDVARPQVSARLLNRSGRAMQALAVESGAMPDGRTQIDLPLGALAPGEYSVETTVTAQTGTAKDTVSFRVTS